MTLKELKDRAAALGIKGRSKMNKAQLEEAIVTADLAHAEDRKAQAADIGPSTGLGLSHRLRPDARKALKTEAQRKRSRAVRRSRRLRVQRRGY
jgi:hypothetical protein